MTYFYLLYLWRCLHEVAFSFLTCTFYGQKSKMPCLHQSSSGSDLGQTLNKSEFYSTTAQNVLKPKLHLCQITFVKLLLSFCCVTGGRAALFPTGLPAWMKADIFMHLSIYCCAGAMWPWITQTPKEMRKAAPQLNKNVAALTFCLKLKDRAAQSDCKAHKSGTRLFSKPRRTNVTIWDFNWVWIVQLPCHLSATNI